jgi:hypothetical protein
MDGYQEWHEESRFGEWNIRTRERVKQSVSTLLDELASLGFAWNDIARMIGVSVPAIQKWRKGDGSTGENHQRVASLLAACDLISEHYMIGDVAGWFEVPVRMEIPIAPVDLWEAGHQRLVFEHAGGQETPDTILSRFDPEWRQRYYSDYEVFTAGDGKRAIRLKDRQ